MAERTTARVEWIEDDPARSCATMPVTRDPPRPDLCTGPQEDCPFAGRTSRSIGVDEKLTEGRDEEAVS